EGGSTGTVTVATFTDPGGPESLKDYSAAIDWGDGSSTSAGVITVNSGVFTVQGNHTYTEESTAEHSGSTAFAINVLIDHEQAPQATAVSSALVSDPGVVATG